MSKILEVHLDRVKTAVLKRYTASQIAKWIKENTTIGGMPYSYKNHEFQETIISDTSQDVNVQKCSQVGLSEVSARMALALVNVLSPYTVIYTLQTAKFAGGFTKTRMDPMIEGSKVMKNAIHPTNNNSDYKQFGYSYIWIKGAASSNAPISTPADHLVHDEVDFSDQEVLGQYQSRLTHSVWRRTHRFSTPTLPKYGIHLAMTKSRRKYLFCKCHHCNHQFIPDYYKHVKIPGYLGDLQSITASTIGKIDYNSARVECPSCGLVPSLLNEHREWVCENPSDNFIAVGYHVTPFDAPVFIQPGYLVEQSTKAIRSQDFVNFSLGLAAEDREATMTRDDFDNVFVTAHANSAVNVMGIDVGGVYHVAIAAVDAYGSMHVVHTEQIPLGLARARIRELRGIYRPICTVMDSQPHAETVMALQEEDQNMYAAVYMQSKSIQIYTVVMKDADAEEGRQFVRQVNINRSKSFDGYMEFVRSGKLTVQSSDENEVVISHHMSMKRVQQHDSESKEMTYSWQKTDGVDHYHHTFQYAWIASKIRGVAVGLATLPLFSVYKFRNNVERTVA